MLTWLAVWLRRVPSIAYVIGFTLALLTGAAVGIYHHGQTVGEASVHRKTLADSVEKQVLVQHVAEDQTDRARRRARDIKHLADSGRLIRNRIRESVIPVLDSLPAPVIRLIEADDAQLKRDSLALAEFVVVDTVWARERALSADLDTLRQHQATLGATPKHGHTALAFVAGAGLGLAALLVLHGLR